MYNEPIKQAFIQEYTKSAPTKKLLRYLFEGTEEIEEKYATDFYAMNAEQAQEALNRVAGIKTNGTNAILLTLRAYVRWCAARGYPVSDTVQTLQIDVGDKLRESYVASPKHLLNSLNEAFPHPEDNQIEYIYRSFLWLGFIGLQVCEAIAVTPENLNFDTMRLTRPVLHPEKMPEDSSKISPPGIIYAEAVPDLKKAIELKELKEPRGKNGVFRTRAPGREILRGKAGKRTLEEAIDATFRPTISRAFKAAIDRYEKEGKQVPAGCSLKITYKNVYMSGIFYRTYEDERMGSPIRFDVIVLGERRNAKESNFTGSYTERRLIQSLISNMEQDYENWKRVFT